MGGRERRRRDESWCERLVKRIWEEGEGCEDEEEMGRWIRAQEVNDKGEKGNEWGRCVGEEE